MCGRVYQRGDDRVEALRLLLRVGPEESQFVFDRGEGLGANTWHAVQPPAAKVRHQHVTAEVQFRFDQILPPARPAVSGAKWRPQQLHQ